MENGEWRMEPIVQNVEGVVVTCGNMFSKTSFCARDGDEQPWVEVVL
jgi:hypothetical protein